MEKQDDSTPQNYVSILSSEWCPLPKPGERRMYTEGSLIPTMNGMKIGMVQLDEKTNSTTVFLTSKHDGTAIRWKRMTPGNPSKEDTYFIEEIHRGKK